MGSLPILPEIVSDPAPLSAADGTANYAARVSQSLAEAVEKTIPSVVVIHTMEDPHYYRDLFGRMYVDRGSAGQGSGFIISEDGYILTNNHVVIKADKLRVSLDNGKEYPARLIGRHPKTDVAVLKIEPLEGEKFTTAEIADSTKIRVGELVLAIGSPFSLSSTVTQGIISHKGRPSEYLPLVDVIQTSAPINPGNSGGPLVDVYGRVIGMNTYIQKAGPGNDGNVGIGFALPSNVAIRVARLIIEGKASELPWIGVVMEDTRYGIYINHVVEGGPAEKAGLQRGDFIQALNGKQIRTTSDLRTYVMLLTPGDPVRATIYRDDESQSLQIITARMPDLKTVQKP
jgi:serine protease Do